MDDENNRLVRRSPEQLPLFERPGRLDPERNVPITRQDRVDVNVHYDNGPKTLIKDSDSPEFTEQSVNALDPFEDTALPNMRVRSSFRRRKLQKAKKRFLKLSRSSLFTLPKRIRLHHRITLPMPSAVLRLKNQNQASLCFPRMTWRNSRYILFFLVL